MKTGWKIFTLSLHLTILTALAWKYGGGDIHSHPIVCIFAVFSSLVILRTMFR